MDFRQDLFNRREIVAILLDLDEETLRRTDCALPRPPSSPSVTRDTPATHAPPQTRFDVARAALMAFVAVKLRSAPNPSSMSFGLYAVRGEGQRVDDVVALVPPTSSGGPSARAVQEALRGLSADSYASRTHIDTPGTPFKSLKKHEDGSPEVVAPYTGVLQRLQQLKDSVDAQQQQQPATTNALTPSPSFTAVAALYRTPFQSSGIFTVDGVAAIAPGNVSERASSDSSGGVCLVVHGIAVRSHSTSLPTLSWSSNAAGTSSSTPVSEGTESSVWLDVVVLDGSLETAAVTAAALSPSRECVVHGCRCTFLDPVELTGITHRGLALGPALVRVMSLPEARTSAFVRRPLSFLKILRSTSAGSDAVFTSASSGKSARPTTPVTAVSDTAVATTTTTVRADHRHRSPPRPLSVNRGAGGGNVGASAPPNTAAGGGVAAERSGVDSHNRRPTPPRSPHRRHSGPFTPA
ncbi:hypothetical protein ABB37_02150 [Leptomonas pyrrhocoris]|uniref:Uncharacterized protein n=1 Tax=Leptomonas pyrrhocoris TaxID=157538 RepID=A0A0N0VGU2_LEPPY|nr:hypothetical protein ABB37_02150 [Leptomonas pyrrhocoris]KPA84014.1 hypothetical protein ABB37_02150 [Leptomonas pyrrhocoris]|eukprot:XP_015662453.1 hypothetical protein ABB37_02150 [Leptomonas pyrrhocoris]